MSKPVLCIIDVQPKFDAAARIVAQTIALVAKFRRSGFPIFLVEYFGYGRSHDSLCKAVSGYGPLYRVIKDLNDGSDEVISVAKINNVSLDRIVICGVNTCYCVCETATGIIKKIPCVIQPAKAALACGCAKFAPSTNCMADLIVRISMADRARKERELEQQRVGQQ